MKSNNCNFYTKNTKINHFYNYFYNFFLYYFKIVFSDSNFSTYSNNKRLGYSS